MRMLGVPVHVLIGHNMLVFIAFRSEIEARGLGCCSLALLGVDEHTAWPLHSGALLVLLQLAVSRSESM